MKLVTDLIYGKQGPVIVGHSWYSKSDYEKIQNTAENEVLFPSHMEWRENAEQTMARMRQRGWFVFKVKVRTADLSHWLREQGLSNIEENREKFIAKRLADFLDAPVI